MRLPGGAKRVLLAIPGAPLAVMLFVYGFWGPPWPTPPVFVPGYPSSGGPYSPFDVPFTVTNKSALFPIKNLEIRCVLQPVRLTTITIKDIAVGGLPNNNKLNPLQTGHYTCPFNQTFLLNFANDRIIEAHIIFETKYVTPFKLWRWQSEVNPADFTLITSTIPPQWTPGVPLH
jgi:hypothetical protein